MKIRTNADKEGRLPDLFTWATVTLCAVPVLLQLSGIDLAFHDSLRGTLVHNLMEWTAVCVAMLTSLIAFTHFAMTNKLLSPIVGAALFWSACLDAFHILASDHFIPGVVDVERFIPLTWTVSRLCGCLILLLGGGILLLAGRFRLGQEKKIVVATLALFGACFFSLVVSCATSQRLPQCQFPASLIPRPYDLIPVELYLLLGIPLFALIHDRYPNKFTHGLLLSLWPEIVSELHMALGSSSLYDAHFNAAHLLKIVAYGLPLAGLLLDYVDTYRAKSGLILQLEAARSRALSASEMLQLNANRMALAEKTAAFGVWEAEFPFKSLHISEGYAALFGLDAGCTEVQLTELDANIHPDDLPQVKLTFRQLTGSDEIRTCEFRYFRPGGRMMWIRACARRERETGKVARITGASIDITGEKEVMARLEQACTDAEKALRVKSEFVANISHEIRTPMNGIIGTIDLLSQELISAEQQEHLKTVRICSDALLGLVNNILDSSKIDAGKLVLERAPFCLHTFVQDILSVVTPAARARGLKIRHNIDAPATLTLVGDQRRLQQVILNLLSNAIKFTESGFVALNIAACYEPKRRAMRVHISVQDSGIGIRKDAQQAIFQPFMQADSSTTRLYGGTGLGLSISAGMVRMMGGELRVESEPGAGSNFSFDVRLPVAQEQTESKRICENTPAAAARSLRVLLAEDNPINQKVAVSLLERAGYSVEVANDGIEALAAVQRSHFDVVLMDCQMPGMDGYEATRAIRRLDERNQIPIVAVTANTFPEDRRKCLDAGMDEFLPKPIVKKELYRLLEGIGEKTAEEQYAELAVLA